MRRLRVLDFPGTGVFHLDADGRGGALCGYGSATHKPSVVRRDEVNKAFICKRCLRAEADSG
jgi:hypothetical protein